MKKLKSATDYNCLRCEASGVIKKADTFVTVDGLLNEDRHPLCYQCKDEWEKEYAKLELDQPLWDL